MPGVRARRVSSNSVQLQNVTIVVPPSEFELLEYARGTGGYGTEPSDAPPSPPAEADADASPSPPPGSPLAPPPASGVASSRQTAGLAWVDTAAFTETTAKVPLLVEDCILGYDVTITREPLLFEQLPFDVVLTLTSPAAACPPPPASGGGGSSAQWKLIVAIVVPVVVGGLVLLAGGLLLVARRRRRTLQRAAGGEAEAEVGGKGLPWGAGGWAACLPLAGGAGGGAGSASEAGSGAAGLPAGASAASSSKAHSGKGGAAAAQPWAHAPSAGVGAACLVDADAAAVACAVRAGEARPAALAAPCGHVSAAEALALQALAASAEAAARSQQPRELQQPAALAPTSPASGARGCSSDQSFQDSFDQVPADPEQLLIHQMDLAPDLLVRRFPALCAFLGRVPRDECTGALIVPPWCDCGMQKASSAPDVAAQLKAVVGRMQQELGDQEVHITGEPPPRPSPPNTCACAHECATCQAHLRLPETLRGTRHNAHRTRGPCSAGHVPVVRPPGDVTRPLLDGRAPAQACWGRAAAAWCTWASGAGSRWPSRRSPSAWCPRSPSAGGTSAQ